MVRALLLLCAAVMASGCPSTLPKGTPKHCRSQYDACMDVCSQSAPATWTEGEYRYGDPTREGDLNTMACSAACREKALRCADVGPQQFDK